MNDKGGYLSSQNIDKDITPAVVKGQGRRLDIKVRVKCKRGFKRVAVYWLDTRQHPAGLERAYKARTF